MFPCQTGEENKAPTLKGRKHKLIKKWIIDLPDEESSSLCDQKMRFLRFVSTAVLAACLLLPDSFYKDAG